MDKFDERKAYDVAFELRAISMLLGRWSNPETVTKRACEWEHKLPAFRTAISAGVGTGAMEAWPWELVVDDYDVVLAAVIYLQNCEGVPYRNDEALGRWLANHMIKFNLNALDGSETSFTRPFPGGLSCEDLRRKAEPLARRITASRLIVDERKVKTSLRKLKKSLSPTAEDEDMRRFESSPGQRHLAAVLLDIASDPDHPDRLLWLVRILDTLYGSKLSLLVICYLLQKVSERKKPILPTHHDAAAIESLCQVVCPSPLVETPFADLLT